MAWNRLVEIVVPDNHLGGWSGISKTVNHLRESETKMPKFHILHDYGHDSDEGLGNRERCMASVLVFMVRPTRSATGATRSRTWRRKSQNKADEVEAGMSARSGCFVCQTGVNFGRLNF